MKPTKLIGRGSVLGVAALAFAVACSDSTEPSKAGTFYGPSQALGQGTARTFVQLDASGTPTALGIALSETALTGLPTAVTPPNPAAAMLDLAFPAEASVTGFDHAEIQWNPMGHEPPQLYGLPHFDFHFYLVPMSQEMAIVPSDPQFASKASNLPSGEYVPQGYITPPGPPAANTVPQMGLHWIDTKAPELNGQTFSKTFIYGSYDGRFIFVEPMITKAYLDSHPNATTPIPQPAKWAIAAYYPTTYTVAYDPTAKEYRITLGGLTQRAAS
jgi:hypothetical protein